MHPSLQGAKAQMDCPKLNVKLEKVRLSFAEHREKFDPLASFAQTQDSNPNRPDPPYPTRPPPPPPPQAVLLAMAPAQSLTPQASSMTGPAGPVGPHPSFINVAKRFIFQQQIQNKMVALGNNPTREDNFRLQGVQWINDVRQALSLPVSTFTVACVHYHKFRLSHKDNEYQYQDASAAALLTACKIEDTLKKSKDILCAAHNLKVPTADHLSPDDITFEGPSKVIIGLERLVLEASGFDFRSFHPHETLVKLLKSSKFSIDVCKLAYNMMIDLHRTFAPLKQVTTTMAFACTELATLVAEKPDDEEIVRNLAKVYERWSTSRAEIVETVLDLLDLYTHFHKSSMVGQSYNLDSFIQIRIKYNQEVEQTPGLSRYTEYYESTKTNGVKTNIKTPKTPITPASPSEVRNNGASPATLSPRSSGSRGISARGQDGTVRFMLDAGQARQEREAVNEYHRVEYEEYEVEVEEPIPPERDDRVPRPHHRPAGGRDDRFHQSKRGRRL